VWLDGNRTSPYEFFQYFRNTDDRDVARFLAYFTFLPMDEIGRLCQGGGSALNQAKEVLATEATRIVHGDQAAEAARRAARSAFGGEDQGAADIPTTTLESGRIAQGVLLVDLLVEVGLCDSKSAARRLVEQGGARLGERRIEGIADRLAESDLAGGSVLLRAGKKKIHRLALPAKK
jgi:tyrosyl-tRNA synthetase